MADDTLPATDEPKRTGTKHYKNRYSPAATIDLSTGITPKTGSAVEDCYSGTREQFIRSGLVPDGMFPGDPGMALGSVTLWPIGPLLADTPWVTPGRMVVTKAPSGKFSARLVVSVEERERREAEQHSKWAEAERQREEAEAMRRAEVKAGFGLATIVQEVGFDAVHKYLARMRREKRPAGSYAHLRLVWSA
jgi:hypothetical protein